LHDSWTFAQTMPESGALQRSVAFGGSPPPPPPHAFGPVQRMSHVEPAVPLMPGALSQDSVPSHSNRHETAALQLTFAHAVSPQWNLQRSLSQRPFTHASVGHSTVQEWPPVHVVPRHAPASQRIWQSVFGGQATVVALQVELHAIWHAPDAHEPPASAHVAGVHDASGMIETSKGAS
jgi:hypothetical protein